METTYLSIQSSLTVIVIVGFFFIGLGYLNSKKTVDNRNYIVGDRDENTFSLTSSLAASALGAWVLFGPASAAAEAGPNSTHAPKADAAKLDVNENVFSSLSPTI